MSARVSGKSRRLLVTNLSAPASTAGGQRGRYFGDHRVEHPQLKSAKQASEGGEFLSTSVPHRLRENLRQQQH